MLAERARSEKREKFFDSNDFLLAVEWALPLSLMTSIMLPSYLVMYSTDLRRWRIEKSSELG